MMQQFIKSMKVLHKVCGQLKDLITLSLPLILSSPLFHCPQQQFEIPAEEAEWVGLSVEEAVEKQRQLEHKVTALFQSIRTGVTQ